MPNVYIPNKSSHDYSDAERFGTLVALTTGNVNISNTSKLYRTMAKRLADSGPEDFILVSGASVVNIIASNIFESMHGKLNLLIFHREGNYVQRNLVFKGR